MADDWAQGFDYFDKELHEAVMDLVLCYEDQ